MPAATQGRGRAQVSALPSDAALEELYAQFGLRLALTSAWGAPVWRCRAPHDATPAQLGLFAQLGLADVWDLRTDDERADAPTPFATEGGPCVHVVPGRLYPPNKDRPRREARGGLVRTPPRDEARRGAAATDEHRDVPGTPGQAGSTMAAQLTSGDMGRRIPGARMLVIYRGMAASAESLAPVVRALTLAKRPVLVCCTSGKDRTGVACYCAQRAVGAPHEEALASYLATNAANAHVNARDIEALAARGVPPWRLEVALSLFLAKEEYLDAFLADLKARYGSLDAYLARCLG